MGWIRTYFAEVAKRSEEEKFNFAFRASTAITLGIFLIWLSNFFVSLSSVMTRTEGTASVSFSEILKENKDIQNFKKLVESLQAEPVSTTETTPELPSSHQGIKELDSTPTSSVEVIPSVQNTLDGGTDFSELGTVEVQ